MNDSSATPETTPHVQVEHRFAQIPEALLYDQSVSAAAVRVYGILHRYGTQPGNCYPGYATIARHIGASDRSVPSWIRELEDAGWILRVPRWRRDDEVTTVHPEDDSSWEQTSNGYFLFSSPRAPEREGRAGERATPRASGRGPGALGRAPKESHENESQLERENPVAAPTGAALVMVDGFNAFWDLYPRRNGIRVGKAKTLQQWKRLTAAQRADVMVCLRNYAAACNSGETLAKDPERWLRPGVWDDWREPPQRTAPTSKTVASAQRTLAQIQGARR